MKLTRNRFVSIFIVAILCFAIFNDLIRIPHTTISAYRLSLPIVLGISFVYLKETKLFFFTGMILLIPLIIQNLIFCNFFEIDSKIDFSWQIRYVIHYVSIIVIFVLVRILRKEDIYLYKSLFIKMIPIMGVLCIIAYLGCMTPYYKILGLANPNDYAVCLATVFPWYFIKSLYGKKRNIFLCIIILVVLWIGDSKAALAGIIIEIGIITSIVFIKKIKEGNKVLIFLIPVVLMIGFAICLSPLKVNGYSIRQMFIGLFTHVLSGNPYESTAFSLGYRTNAIIYCIKGLFESYFLGIGIGNTGKLLRKRIPNHLSNQALSHIALSPHNAILEFFCDCGLWAIILCFYIYGIAIKKLFHAKNLDLLDIYFVSFTLSFPMWSMSASGIYTIFLLFIVIAWLYESSFLSASEREYII